MAYATTAQIQTAAGGAARYVQLFDWDEDAAADTDEIERLQAAVDSWIDSYAGTRYAVPMSTPSAETSACAAEEVVYRARKLRGPVSEDDQKAHEGRLAWLKDVSAGKAVPCDPLPAPASTVRSAWVDRSTDAVSREGTKGFW